MPKCDSCGFAHAQPDHCINCGDRDPFRRRRLMKLLVVATTILTVALLSFYFYTRYTAIERSIRQADVSPATGEGVDRAPAGGTVKTPF